jgi:hypothetical protein
LPTPFIGANLGLTPRSPDQNQERDTSPKLGCVGMAFNLGELKMAVAFKIENKPAIPRGSKYPFRNMKVGQSFYFKARNEQERVNVASAAHMYGQLHDMKFSTVKDGAGYRCGRVA